MLRVLQYGIKPREKYSEVVRNFCFTLRYHSPSAYVYLRKFFNNHLPHPNTIQCWFSNSDVNGQPGIQTDHLEKLKRIASDFESLNKRKMICSLVFDEMYIRKQMLWSLNQSKYIGFINYGENPNDEKKRIATQAITFILNGINSSFEFPVAYFFIDKLDKFQRKDLVVEIVTAVTNCKIKISNLTFDGHPSNACMCELLGANLAVDSSQFQSFFLNPVDGEKIYLIFDPCHMEKLLRNTLGIKKTIYDHKNEKVEYKYFEALHKYSKENGFHTHKLSRKHMQWARNSMSVRLAVETLSASVANAMQFLLEQKHPDFVGAEATIR